MASPDGHDKTAAEIQPRSVDSDCSHSQGTDVARSRRSSRLREAFGARRSKTETPNPLDDAPVNVNFHSILPYYRRLDGIQKDPELNLQWYNSWVLDRMREQPDTLFQSLVGQELSSPSTDLFQRFDCVWRTVATYMERDVVGSVDNIVQYLIEEGLIKSKESRDDACASRALIFTVIGWQTMLYRADFGSSPVNELSINDELQGYSCSSRLALRQQDDLCKRPIHQALLSFGVLLPPPNFSLEEDEKVWTELKTIDPSSCNGQVLKTIGLLTIEWVDSLSCHLELDQSVKILYLYRYPSFCVANISSGRSNIRRDQGPLHGCALPRSASGAWATKEEVTRLLHETITTYRLLFGQTKAGRRYFRQLTPFEGVSVDQHDSLLSTLCSRKQANVVAYEHELYDLERHFPIYRSRLVALHNYLSTRKARSWRDLWNDKRDSAQWLTFWLVAIIGGLGILFAFMQVVLQIVQIVVT